MRDNEDEPTIPTDELESPPAVEGRRRRRRLDTVPVEAVPGVEDPAGPGVSTGAPEAGERPTAAEPEEPPPYGHVPGGARVRRASPAKAPAPVVPAAPVAPSDPARARVVPTGKDELGRVDEVVIAEDKAAAEHWDQRRWNDGRPA